MTNKTSPLHLAALCAALALTQGLSGCAPLVVGGAMAATTMMATDRRSAGTQVDDQSNELKAVTAIQGVLGERGHVAALAVAAQGDAARVYALVGGREPVRADGVPGEVGRRGPGERAAGLPYAAVVVAQRGPAARREGFCDVPERADGQYRFVAVLGAGSGYEYQARKGTGAVRQPERARQLYAWLVAGEAHPLPGVG